jgi:hypothetical protein
MPEGRIAIREIANNWLKEPGSDTNGTREEVTLSDVKTAPYLPPLEHKSASPKGIGR